ncbi:hypothetical protein [Streptomyces sp. CC210A]|uniref:hypothetical protein n=1 Tax=Streptomyces sp. CC210A TaxID=2898184 RepID=UPI0027E496BE|nr:hypothetical protein [Streptomyces sp. CC210A]
MSLGTSASGLLLLGVTAAFTGVGSTALAVVGYGLVYLGLGAAKPSENDLLHRRVTRSGRATALSVQSLALQLAAALTGLVVSVLPPGPLPWLLGGAVLLAGASLWARPSGCAPTPAVTPEPRTTRAAPTTSTGACDTRQEHVGP